MQLLILENDLDSDFERVNYRIFYISKWRQHVASWMSETLFALLGVKEPHQC